MKKVICSDKSIFIMICLYILFIIYNVQPMVFFITDSPSKNLLSIRVLFIIVSICFLVYMGLMIKIYREKGIVLISASIALMITSILCIIISGCSLFGYSLSKYRLQKSIEINHTVVKVYRKQKWDDYADFYVFQSRKILPGIFLVREYTIGYCSCYSLEYEINENEIIFYNQNRKMISIDFKKYIYL